MRGSISAGTPYLKSGKGTKYRNLPNTCIILITQENLFGRDRAKYVFEEWCHDDPGLPLEDGAMKIFLNMKSKNGRPELVSLLQYMKDTRLDNPEILVKDERIVRLDQIVAEVKQSEEWEDVRMSIYLDGIERGRAEGMERGRAKGVEEGMEHGMVAMVKTLKELLPDAESVWNAVTENDIYKDVSLRKIKQLY